MSRDKYLANIDKVLQKVVTKTSDDLSYHNKIAYSEELEKNGTFKKIAFDVYKVEHDPYSGLWTLEELEGKPYLVRASDPQYESVANGDWTVISDYDKKNVTLAYKKVPIARFSSERYKFDSNDIITFKSALLDNINQNSNFIKSVLLEQPDSKRSALVSTFPEFNKFLQG